MSRANVAVRVPVISRLLTAAACALLLGAQAASAQNVPVRIIAINDFHGHLEPADNTIAVRDPANPATTVPLRSGGAAFLATRINQLKAEQPRHVVVSAGDLVGASPLTSGPVSRRADDRSDERDRPRHQRAGKSRIRSRSGAPAAVGQRRLPSPPTANRQTCAGITGKFSGARFSFLAANVLYRENEQPIVPPTWIKSIDGVRIGFIGAVTRATPGIVVPGGVAGVRFVAEAKALNQYAKDLQAQGVQAIVAVVHEGGDAEGGYDACRNPRGAIFDIARELDAAIDIVLSAHTHRGYNCIVDGRVIVQAASYGRLVSVVDIEIDRASGKIVRERTHARNVPVPNGVRTHLGCALPSTARARSESRAIVEHYRKLAAPLAQRPVGRIAADFDRRASAGGDSALGRLIADAQLAVTRSQGAQLAFTNPGGLRADLRASGDEQRRDLRGCVRVAAVRQYARDSHDDRRSVETVARAAMERGQARACALPATFEQLLIRVAGERVAW